MRRIITGHNDKGKSIVTIDGPAASGKEKIAKFISRKWNLDHLDSGVLYRQIALKHLALR